MTNEFILIKGKKAVVHSDKCKCTKRSGVQQCVYGYTKEELTEGCFGIDKNSVQFAKCAETKIELINK